MKLNAIALAALLAGCSIPEPAPADRAVVSVSDGVSIIVAREANGMWNATPRSPSAYRRWGMQRAAADGVAAIEMHTGCRAIQNTLINYNLTVRAHVVC